MTARQTLLVAMAAALAATSVYLTLAPWMAGDLATLARERYQLKPAASSDRLRTRVQRRYLKEHYPILFDRVRGLAAAFGRRKPARHDAGRVGIGPGLARAKEETNQQEHDETVQDDRHPPTHAR